MPRLNWLDVDLGKQRLSFLELIASRLTHVQILALGAFTTGWLLVLTGSQIVPYAPGFGAIPGWPWFYGSILGISGSVLLWALAIGRHGAAITASLASAGVYLVLAAGFTTVWVERWFDDVPGNVGFPPYMVAMYLLNGATMHLGHAVTERAAWHRERVDVALARLEVRRSRVG